MADAASPAATSWRQGRFTCPTCQITRTAIYQADVTELRCPTCETVTVPA